MLDTATKKRIDDCRDILVGKLPDPKAQIEQITIALIYKFMDDMDKEAIELGGKAKFFTNYTIPDPDDPKKKKTVPFALYSWDNLFNTKVTATEMLRLYSEAIVSMDKNPNIPPLFRNIFKNAFLPYRDPETLKLFLKTINEFEYSHSEKLGDAFEYLLSVMGSQGDAGQFRTPRHIIDFIVAVVDPGKTDTILDPACGTAGFLISAFKHIKEKNKKGITPDERKKLIQNFVGYDISPDMVRLSLVNLYLHGFSDPHIHEYDTLTSEDRWNESFDVILANPPFMSPKGGIRPHKKFSISSNRSEVLFVDYIAEHLSPKGRAGIIVPEGVIFQSGIAYKDLRKMLVENYLYAVASLPAGVFNPYSGVKTSILLMDKELSKKRNEILFIKIDNDGYGLGAQRAAVKGTQLGEAVEAIQQFKEGNFERSTLAHAVSKKEIAKNGDYNLSGERYKTASVLSSEYPFLTLDEVCEINPEATEPSSYNTDTFIYLDISSVENGTGKVNYDNIIKTNEAPSRAKRKVINSDIILSTVRPNLKAFGFIQEPPNNTVASTGFAVLRVMDKLNSKFLFYNLFSDNMVDQMISMMGKGSYPSINQTDVASLKIPIPPLSEQEEIVAEIEGYQKIIDGAKAVVENYKPNIAIDPGWETVELGDLTTFVQGINTAVDKLNYVASGIKVLQANNIYLGSVNYDKLKYISPDEYETIEAKYKPNTDDVLYSNIGARFGYASILENDEPSTFSWNVLRLIINDRERIDKNYLKNILNTDFLRSVVLSKSSTSTMPFISGKELKLITVPLPSIKTQRQIVSQIEKEQTLVNGNKKLIEIFEQKIKDRIAKVWGPDKSATAYKENDVVSMAAEE